MFVSFFCTCYFETLLQRTNLLVVFIFYPFFKALKYLTESSVEGDNLVKENNINKVFLLLPLCQYSELPSMEAVLFL